MREYGQGLTRSRYIHVDLSDIFVSSSLNVFNKTHHKIRITITMMAQTAIKRERQESGETLDIVALTNSFTVRSLARSRAAAVSYRF